jgi:hypothetical protein
MSGESLNQLMMVVTIGEARLKPPKFMPRVHLGNHQGNNSPVTNTMEGDLPGTHRDILYETKHQIAPSVRSPSSIVHR